MYHNSTVASKIALLFLSIIFVSISSRAQVSPSLKFVRPVLSSGTAGQQGAVYKFSNVIAGVDAFVTIDKITNNATLVNIDDTTMGYYNAWQPIVGGPGITGQSSEIRWVIEFKNTDGSKHKFSTFDISAIDIDGDNGKIREYVGVNGQSSFNLPTSIPTLMNMSTAVSPDGDDGGNDDEKGLGPIANRPAIDTTALDTRVNYKFLNKDKIKVTTGAQVDNNGYTGGIATDRYYSMYFKPVSNIIVSVLPVTLRTFDAVAINNTSANLYWVTETERSNDHFEVERSFDEKSFKKIGVVLAAQSNTNSANQYNFKDASSDLNGQSVVYYRLRQVDIDNNFTYSPIKAVHLTSNTKSFVQVYPNPCMNKLNINFVSDESGTAEVRIINTLGQISISQQSSIFKGYNNIQLNKLGSTTPGIYLARLLINGQTIATQKIIKQ